MTSWRDELRTRLQDNPCCGYGPSDGFATEPSALAALALAQWGCRKSASRVAEWLAGIQGRDGSVGIRAGEPEPGWPTALAVLVWQALSASPPERVYYPATARAVAWILGQQGSISTRTGEPGHDPSIPAWSWVPGTHAWVEPTAFCVLGLTSAGHCGHPRTREAVRMLLDRQLSGGGWNYGNTLVLGRELRAHLQPTGLALLAVGSVESGAPDVRRSLDFVARHLSEQSSTVSLSWCLLGLAAHGRWPGAADAWLEGAYQRTLRRGGALWKLALLALAAERHESLLVTLTRDSRSNSHGPVPFSRLRDLTTNRSIASGPPRAADIRRKPLP